VPPPEVILDFVEQLGKLGVAEVDDPKGMAAWFAEQRGVTSGGLPVERYIDAVRELLAELPSQRILPNASTGDVLSPGAASHPWQWLGPANRGGRTRAFVVDPRDPQVMLAGGITGGVWKSSTGGTSWRPLTDTLANIAVGVLEMDPANPDVVYAGTGEIYYAPEPYGWYRGGGIMRSVDAGSTWTFLDSTVANPDFAWVGDVEVSPHDSNRLYAATSTGVWVSDDAGLSWSRTLVPRTTAGCLELAVRNDLDPDTVFASCGSELGTLPQAGPNGPPAGDGVYRSTDGGQTWVRVIIRSGGRAVGVTSLAIAPSDQDVIYANAADLDGNALAMFRSTEGGESGSWEVRNAGTPNWFANCRYDYAQGGYDNVVAVDPTDPNRIWVGGVDLFRSANAGKTFQIASDWAAPETSTAFVHADQHLIVFDPGYDGTTNRTVYFGNDGGIFSTTDDRADLSGSSCGSIQGATYGSLRTGFGVAQFVGGAVADDGSVILGGTQDNGTVQTTTGSPDDWVAVQGGDGGFAAVDEQRDVRYVTNPRYTDPTFGTTYIMMSRSDQGGPFDLKPAADIDAVFYPPLVRDPDDGRLLWTGGQSVLRTLDAGDNWESVTDYYDSKVTAIGVAADDGSEVWVGFRDGTLIRSGNALAATPKWVSADPSGGLPFGQVSAVAIDPTNHRTAFVTISEFDGHQVWRTADAGATWTAVDADLPEVPANAVAINPRNPAMVYVGTDTGVFESLNGGETWRVANQNLATTIVSQLVFRKGTSELYAFTFGRGLYRVDVGSLAPPVNDDLDAATPVFPDPAFQDRVDTRLATTVVGDPDLTCGPTADPRQSGSVWYRLQSPTGGSLTLSTEGSAYDTVLGVFVDTPVLGEHNLVPVACDDDGIEAGGASILTLDATPGIAYFVEVARASDAPPPTVGSILVFTAEPA
jgi:photosystem II stability/assembly factor-like uncharacterized protein